MRNKGAKILLFWLVGVILFIYIQNTMTQVFCYPQNDNYGQLFYEFNRQTNNIDEVLFVGTSHVQFGISPLQMYKDNGIVSYNLGTGGQPLEVSYELIKTAFKTQKPKVILLDCSKVVNDLDLDQEWRFVLDSMPMSLAKFEIAKTYAISMSESTNDMNYYKKYISGILPILVYHDRWKNLNVTDFQRGVYLENSFTNGYFLSPRIEPSICDIEAVDNEAYISAGEDYGYTYEYRLGDRREYIKPSKLYAPVISPESEECLIRIKELCDKNHAELLLVKIPTNCHVVDYEGSWTRIKSNIVKEYVAKNDMTFLDLQYDVDLSLDWNKDSYDGGRHLNYNGAKKVSSYLGNYLVDTYNLGGNSIAQMDSKLTKYICLTKCAEIESCTNVLDYLNLLGEEKENYIICMAVSDYYFENLPEELKDAFGDLGLFRDDLNDKGRCSFICCIDAGKNIYEAISNRELEWSYEKKYDNQPSIYIKSSGWYTKAMASIIVNEVEYSINLRGLNVVVIDKASGIVIDRMITDSIENPYICSHAETIDLNEKYMLRLARE